MSEALALDSLRDHLARGQCPHRWHDAVLRMLLDHLEGLDWHTAHRRVPIPRDGEMCITSEPAP